jgi:hypothetical protein
MIFAFAALAVALAIQPSQAPQEKGAAKGHSAQNTSTTENTNSTQKPSQPHPQAMPPASQPTAHTNQSNGTSEAENVQVQRWIEIFTGVLASVGVLQLVVMFFTLRVYSRQAGIMARQADLMEGGLSVDPPRMINFEDGKRPSVFVKVVNSGIVPAKDVSVSLKFEIGDHTNFSSAQVITIRAGKSRKCFIPSNVALRTGDVLAIHTGEMVLRVIVSLTQPKKPKKREELHCYKFYPWPPSDTRPKGLPQFVECDFDVRTSTSAIARLTGASAEARLGTVTAKAENPPTDTPKEPSDPN